MDESSSPNSEADEDPTRALFRQIGWGPVLGFVMFASVFPFAMHFGRRARAARLGRRLSGGEGS